MGQVTETFPHPPRTWVEFADPDDYDPATEHPHTMIRADLTWLTSSWTCIFGQGCPGIDAESPDVGCCRLGAHFSDKDDERRVARYVDQLTPQMWQRHPGRKVRRKDWVSESQGERQTKVSEFGCIFANDPNFVAAPGCALHALAMSLDEPHLVTKPDVCWQLPIRRTYRTVTRPDDTEYLEVTIAEYDRAGWGPGGHDLDWYCTSNPQAHIGADPVYVAMADELTELLGAPAYAELAEHCRSVRTAQKLLPLSVHPATAAANTA